MMKKRKNVQLSLLRLELSMSRMASQRSQHCDNHYSCAVRCLSYKMGSVSSFWCHICERKFMLAYIYHAIFRVGGEVGDYLKYSSVAAKILLLCWENVWKVTIYFAWQIYRACYQQSTTHPMFQASKDVKIACCYMSR